MFMQDKDAETLFWYEPRQTWFLRKSRISLPLLMPRVAREAASAGLVMLRLLSLALICIALFWAIMRVAGFTQIDAPMLSSALGLEIAYLVLAITALGVLWLSAQMFLPPRVIVMKEGVILERPHRVVRVVEIEQLQLVQDARRGRMLKISVRGLEYSVGISRQVDTPRIASILGKKVIES